MRLLEKPAWAYASSVDFMDEATLNKGALALLGVGLAVAMGGWVATLLRRKAPPLWLWFVVPLALGRAAR